MFIQILRKRLANMYAVAPLVVLMMFIGVRLGAAPAATIDYSGEDLFRGIFYGEGPVADRLPYVSDLNPGEFLEKGDELQEYQDLKEEIIAGLSANNPSFFDNFRSQMLSSNHLTIQRGLEDAAEAIQEVSMQIARVSKVSGEMANASQEVENLLENDPEFQHAIATGNADGAIAALNSHMGDIDAVAEQVCLVKALVLFAAVAIYVVAAVEAAVALTVTFWAGTDLVDPNTTLVGEQIVQAISEL
jgi:SdpC family antimicrobial peptide